MALKTDLSDMSITSTRATIGTLNVTLKAWNALDNTMVDPPVIDEIITEQNVKYYVENEDPSTLADRVYDKIKDKVQGKINYYQEETERITNVTSAFQNMITDIDGTVTSKVIE